MQATNCQAFARCASNLVEIFERNFVSGKRFQKASLKIIIIFWLSKYRLKLTWDWQSDSWPPLLLKLNDRPNKSFQRPLRVSQMMPDAQRWCCSMRILKVTRHRQSWLFSWLFKRAGWLWCYDGLAKRKRPLLCTQSDNPHIALILAVHQELVLLTMANLIKRVP